MDERNEAGLKKAIQYFERAVERDPLYALAYVGTADAYNLLEVHGYMSTAESHPKAEKNLTRALEIDDELSEAHTAFGAILEDDWDWSRSEAEFKRAIQLNPSYATAHHWYSILLSNLGRLDEALAEVKRARELDPLSPIILTALGATYHYRREYDLAIEAQRKALELDPDFIPAHFNLVGEYIAKSMVKELTAFIPRLRELLGDAYVGKGGWAILYAFLGMEEDARRTLKEAESVRGEHYVPPVDIATAHMYLGEMDEAFKWLDIAYEERSSGLAGMKAEPAFDPLRSDPRYGVLLKKLRLDG